MPKKNKKDKENKKGGLNARRVYHPILKKEKGIIVDLREKEIAEYKNRFFKF